MRQLSWNQGCDLKLALLFYSWRLHQRGNEHEIDKFILSQVIAGLMNRTNPVEHLLLIDNQLVVHSVLLKWIAWLTMGNSSISLQFQVCKVFPYHLFGLL